MNKVKSERVRATLGAVLIALLCVGCADPISDDQVKTMAEHCENIGMRLKVFNGLVSKAECVWYSERNNT